MDARAVTEMACRACGARGPVGRRCAVCAAPQAGYYCDHCRHFDDSGAHTFHCPFCDVCRRGHGLGVDFHHCMRCNMCVDITQLATHVCTGAAGRACGACGGDLAATPDRVVVLGCGHPAHARCAAAPPGRCLVCARAAAHGPAPAEGSSSPGGRGFVRTSAPRAAARLRAAGGGAVTVPA